MPRKTPTYSPADLRALAEEAYDAALAAAPAPFYLPADAKRSISEATGIPAAKLASYVDPVYFRRNGERNPIPLPAKRRGPAAVAKAVAKRRNAGGTLGRWESLAASLAATLGRPVSEPTVRALVAKGGVDLDASYTGRGTRKGAPTTREDATAELSL